MTIYFLHLFQGGLAIFFRTMGAESTWNFKKKLLLVFEVGSFWQFFRIFSADDPGAMYLLSAGGFLF
jgi:hypothetical protein